MTVEGAFGAAVEAAVWLGPSDKAAVSIGRALAIAFDEAVLDEDRRAVKDLSAQLLAVCKSLGLAPLERRALAGGAPVSKVDELKAQREKRRRAATSG